MNSIALGVEDFGIFNIVGGAIAMLGCLCVFNIIWKAGAFLLTRRSERHYAELGLPGSTPHLNIAESKNHPPKTTHHHINTSTYCPINLFLLSLPLDTAKLKIQASASVDTSLMESWRLVLLLCEIL